MGSFIALYGANNLGKTTQVELLCQRLKDYGIGVKMQKWPVYDLEPTGPEINRILRAGVMTNEVELQRLFARNRYDFEPILRGLLEVGWVVAEDYRGTGIAWGVVNGISVEEMEKLNDFQLDEDLAILLDGEVRFVEAIEVGHRHEDRGDALWIKARDVHRELAVRYGWKVVDANQGIAQVHEKVWSIVETVLEKG